MARTSVDYPDLGGGVNQDASAAALKTREMTDIRNFYPYSTRLRRPKGNGAEGISAPQQLGQGITLRR